MRRVIIAVEKDSNLNLYELCLTEQQGDTRLRHDDYFLTCEELWKLKQQVDRAWFDRKEDIVDA